MGGGFDTVLRQYPPEQIGDTHDYLGGAHVHSHHQRRVRNQRVGRGRASDPARGSLGWDEAHHAGVLEVGHQSGHGRLRQARPAGQGGARDRERRSLHELVEDRLAVAEAKCPGAGSVDHV